MEQMLRVSDVAKLVGVKLTTVRKWVKEGSIPAPIRLNGKTMMWTREQIQLWINSQPKKRDEHDSTNQSHPWINDELQESKPGDI
jgi:prophage regulatory protein